MRIPILAYHAVNIGGNDYGNNDHLAFAADLRLIHELGLRVVPLAWAVDQLLGSVQRDLERCVALTCDDGSDFDFYDLDHPQHGPQRSLYNCLGDFATEHGATAQPDLHLTSFVIASPDARAHLDRNCLVGRGWMSERWWQAASASGRMAIENHSWDHNHATLPHTAQHEQRKGTFKTIDSYTDADAEIRAAADWLNVHLAPNRSTLFAYPYGEWNDYLVREYLPHYMHEHRLRAAFTGEPHPVEANTDRWLLPRYVCGPHWKTPGELEKLLRGMRV